MKTMQSIVFILALTVDASLQSSQTNPIQKVLQLLNELKAKVTADGETEQKQYEEFADWCKEEATAKTYEINDGKAKSAELTAAIAKLDSSIQEATAGIESLSSKISTDQKDLQAATMIRKKEHEDFVAADTELDSSIDMLGRAHKIIETNLNGGSFMQMNKDADTLTDVLNTVLASFSINTQDKNRLQALVQTTGNSGDDDDLLLSQGAPEPAAYKSKSGAILETLEDMKEKSETMRADAQKSEMKAQFNFDMMEQALKTAIKQAEKDLEETKKSKAVAEEGKSTAEGDLSTTNKNLADSEKAFKDLSIDCQETAAEWEEAQKERAAELEAITTATKIITESTGGAENLAYSFVQLKTAVRSSSAKLVSLLQSVAQDSGDAALSQLAARVRSVETMETGKDVFAKIKGMISDMIDKLIKEAQEEAEKKAYCDKEMSESEAKIEDHNAKLDTMHARSDKAVATTAKLEEEIKTLDAEIAELVKSQAEMDKMRKQEKDEFAKVSKDLKDGIDGLTMALSVLREYYAEKEEGEEALVQTGKETGAASGIIGMLEVAQSDFNKMLSEAEVKEDTAQSEYEKVSQDNKVSKAEKETTLTGNKKTISELAKSIDEISSDIEGEQTELDAVNEYYEKLKPECITKPEPYEERKKRRENEIAGLKEGLEILEQESGTSFLSRRIS